jgi:hypothetical protein
VQYFKAQFLVKGDGGPVVSSDIQGNMVDRFGQGLTQSGGDCPA